MTVEAAPDVDDVLRDRFGLSDFRPGQREVIDRLLAGTSAVAIFPTGAGKSLCYQLPALMLDGLTLVISPLIALMKDQIDALQRRGIAAARLDSTIEHAQAVDTYRDIRDGSLKILYVAPERLANERFLQLLGQLKISMMAVDEAHCISEWGHSFRPDYLKLAALARRLKIERILALTATATPPVALQIARAFGIDEADIVRTGFYRPNLAMSVTPVTDQRRNALLLSQLKRRPRGPTIVYVTLQRTAEEVAAFLSASGFDAVAYHAGMKTEDRHAVQEHFMQSGETIVCATIAFGMGIDKRDIRYVYHYNLPKSLENYAQEIGRAGRDGRQSLCEVLACADDRIVLENFIFGDTPEPPAVRALVDHLLSRGEAFDVSTHELARLFDIRQLVVETLLTYLQLDGLLESTGPFYTEYKFHWLKPEAQVLQQFDPARAAFLRQVLREARLGKTLFSIDVHHAAERIGQPRQRLIAALNYLDEQGAIDLQASGVRQGFRRLKAVKDVPGLSETMSQRFARRETRDRQRLEQVLAFCGDAGCKTQKLLAYFGESLPGDCGHCGSCRGANAGSAGTFESSSRPVPTDRIRAGVAEARALRKPSLGSPRQIARFLCGINSPAVSRDRLGSHALFGRFADVPFAEVLDLCQ